MPIRWNIPLLAAVLSINLPPVTPQQPAPQADVLVVGAGITGLSAALEAAKAGARGVVVERSSVWGGHAVVSAGAVSLVATPLQARKGIQDSPALAAEDFRTWGEDADPAWVRVYAERSREEIYDWLTGLGVSFDNVIQPDGNRVARLHQARGKGIGLVGPLFRACLAHPNVRFLWNANVERLLMENRRVTGVAVEHLRTGQKSSLRAGAVILATGGFQSNLEMVRSFWPRNLPQPPRLLLGAGHDAVGDGHRLAQQTGAAWHQMDHQWNYALGLPDPRDPSGRRGLAAFNPASIWVNQRGQRFTNEFAGAKHSLPALLVQPGATYWAVFDAAGKPSFKVTLAGWEDFRELDRVIFANPRLVRSAPTLDELAQQTGLPSQTLAETVARWNGLVAEGADEFGRFGADTKPRPAPIRKPPFYAMQFFPITRKSMGGIAVDASCRVLDSQRQPIAGLYAAGEAAGFGGVNGRAALEGTFLGPGVLMGRVAARAAWARRDQPRLALPTATEARLRAPLSAPVVKGQSCVSCHDVRAQVAQPPRGYWHYAQSHRVVLERGTACLGCHPGMVPYRPATHRTDRLAQSQTCAACHGAQEAGNLQNKAQETSAPH